MLDSDPPARDDEPPGSWIALPVEPDDPRARAALIALCAQTLNEHQQRLELEQRGG